MKKHITLMALFSVAAIVFFASCEGGYTGENEEPAVTFNIDRIYSFPNYGCTTSYGVVSDIKYANGRFLVPG
jgi:hypothetical protein